MRRSTVWKRHQRRAELARLIREHRLHDVAAEVGILRPAWRDGRAGVGAPDHLIGRRLDLLALEEILALLVAGEIDHLVAAVAHRLGDREQHGVARARRRAAARSRLREFRSARRSAPSRRPARPCADRRTSRLDTPSSSAISDSSPFSLSTHAPVSAMPSISSGTSRPPDRPAARRVSKFCSR